MPTTPDWQRLGRAIRKRRKELGYRQRDLKEHGGPSVVTVRLIETAQHPSPRPGTFDDLETALQWPTGTCQQILNGDRPTTATYQDLLTQLATTDIHAHTNTLITQLADIEKRPTPDIIHDALTLYITTKTTQ